MLSVSKQIQADPQQGQNRRPSAGQPRGDEAN